MSNSNISTANSIRSGIAWIIKIVIMIALGLYTASIYSQDSWLATHYHADQPNPGDHFFLTNLVHSFFGSFSFMFGGHFGVGLLHFFLPLTIVLIYIGLASSLNKK